MPIALPISLHPERTEKSRQLVFGKAVSSARWPRRLQPCHVAVRLSQGALSYPLGGTDYDSRRRKSAQYDLAPLIALFVELSRTSWKANHWRCEALAWGSTRWLRLFRGVIYSDRRKPAPFSNAQPPQSREAMISFPASSRSSTKVQSRGQDHIARTFGRLRVIISSTKRVAEAHPCGEPLLLR